ncbi:hypothetical protein BGX38DRAFT_1182816, partial [Terfezia claveryi]
MPRPSIVASPDILLGTYLSLPIGIQLIRPVYVRMYVLISMATSLLLFTSRPVSYGDNI